MPPMRFGLIEHNRTGGARQTVALVANTSCEGTGEQVRNGGME